MATIAMVAVTSDAVEAHQLPKISMLFPPDFAGVYDCLSECDLIGNVTRDEILGNYPLR